jgi:hypothetical protein
VHTAFFQTDPLPNFCFQVFNPAYNALMRRLIALAVSLVVVASVQSFAQRGGGHGSAGGHGGFSSHGGFSGGHASAGHAFGGRAMGGVRSGIGFSARSSVRGSFNRGLTTRRFSHSGVGLQLRTRGFRNNCFGFRCGNGYGYPWLGGIDPYWWWDSGSSYDQDQQDQLGLANEMNQQSLEEQRMRHQGDQDMYARSAPPSPRVPERTEAAPATVLVFRDQRKQEVQNYAIVGQTLWNFAPQHTEKIPLSDLDLAATAKANDARGVDFRLPNAPEGQ